MVDILVVGGAGYIGSHMCKYLSRKKLRPVVLDNLIYGHREAVKWGPFFEGRMDDPNLLDEIFSRFQIQAVMHFAAFTYVGESVEKPAKYYANNVAATIGLLDSMIKHDVVNFIFSSTCAVYGEPRDIPIDESHSLKPVNPYGRGKLMVEQILDDFHFAYGLNTSVLRYFNAAGADPDGEIGEDHDPETHLIPLVIQAALGQRDAIQIYGTDYPTPDGTCIRDYIHINDLAQAHYLALEKLLNHQRVGVYNLGNESGYSVRDVIASVRKISKQTINEKYVERRAGDPAVLVGSAHKASAELGWRPQFASLDSIIETAWNWHREHPGGY